MAAEGSLKARLTGLMLTFMVFSVVLLGRAGWIQLINDPRLEKMARRQFQSHSLIKPRRGAILDRNGEALAVNLEAKSLAANPGKIQNKRAVARILSRSTDVPFSKLIQKLNEAREFVWIKRHLTESELKKLNRWGVMDLNGGMMEGFWLVRESDRVYPHGPLASHVLGDVNVDSEGIEGMELWMNERLTGKVISVSAIRDALGRPAFMDTEAARNVQDGFPVTLTIDARLQFEIEKGLSSAIKKTSARAGTVIVMNSVTGEILAMANEPGFDRHEKGNAPDRRRNRAVTDGYEPGSTLKTLLVASALTNGWKVTDRVHGGNGSLILQGHRITEAESHEKFEWMDLGKLLQVSSNVGAAKLALRLGPDRYLKTLHFLGFGKKTGIGFPGEISGRLPSRRDMSPLTLANIGFGQGVLVSPLQMVRAYATFLNGGWLVHPTLIKSPTEKNHPSGMRVFSQRLAQEILGALEGVTAEGGTGVKAALPGYRVAGKTGTAQIVDAETGRYSRDKYLSSFIGFPLGVEPKVVIYASLLEPKGVYYAAETAVPLFRDVLLSVTQRFDMRPQPLEDRIVLSKAAEVLALPDLSVSLKPFGEPGASSAGKAWIMPALRGLSPREVFKVLQGKRFKLEVRGNGVVDSQSPEAGKGIAEGDLIRLRLLEP